jgi:hypothetical protein
MRKVKLRKRWRKRREGKQGGMRKDLKLRDGIDGGEGVHEDQEEDGAEDDIESEDENTGSLSSSTSPIRSPSPIPGYDAEAYDRPRRIKDTRLRAEYARLLATFDPRFATDGFWEARKEPLKFQHMVTHGWAEWMLKDKWLVEAAARIGDEKGQQTV